MKKDPSSIVIMPMASTKTSSLPWELLLDLVSRFLDPSSLAVACCVSKQWNSALSSSDHLWRSLCLSHYPSSLHLLTPSHHPAANPPRRLFSLLQSTSARRRRVGRAKPRISLRHLLFLVDVFRADGAPAISLARSGEELADEDGCGGGSGGIVRFEIDLLEEAAVEVGAGEKVRVTWMVVMKGWGGAFSVMDREGRGRVVEGDGVWFSEELPAGPGECPLFAGGGGLVAELGLGFCGGSSTDDDHDDGDGDGRRRKLGRVSLGMMSVVEWRYVGLEDGLLYLQQFLLPPNYV